MKPHTPEPWTSGTDPSHFDAPEVRNSAWAMYVPTDADARRIVACVNACAGLSTEALEAGVLESVRNYLSAIVEHQTKTDGRELKRLASAALSKLEGK
jgi:hypothetical protein